MEKKWYFLVNGQKKGINYVADVWDSGGNDFIEYEDLCNKIDFQILYTEYAGITAAIGKIWKEELSKNSTGKPRKNAFHKFKDIVKPVKFMYLEFAQDEALLAQKTCCWNLGYNLNITSEDLVKVINNINKITICVKLRSFQYKLLMLATVTNIDLKRYGIKESELCTFCEETICNRVNK